MTMLRIIFTCIEMLVTAWTGALAAASIYLLIAIQGRQIFSVFTMDYAILIALLSVPTFVIAANFGKLSVVAIIITVPLSIMMLLQIFGQAFAVGLPGTDWVMQDQLAGLFIMPFVAAVALLLRRPRQLLLLMTTSVVSLIILVAGLQWAVQSALDQQFSNTFAKGGCVIAGYDLTRERRRKVAEQSEIQRGWFIGSNIEPVYFVFPDHYLRWSFSRLGLVTRGGQPESYPLYGDIKC